jgi:hypothetical protein
MLNLLVIAKSIPLLWQRVWKKRNSLEKAAKAQLVSILSWP